jgi:hypothetical protein
MSKSNIFMNWVDFTFTPPSGPAINIAKVRSCDRIHTDTPVTFKGDDANFVQMIAVPTQEESLEINFGDVRTAAMIPIGVVGSVSITLADVKNGVNVGGGGIVFTLNPCVAIPKSASTLRFMGLNPTDGTVNPLTAAKL